MKYFFLFLIVLPFIATAQQVERGEESSWWSEGENRNDNVMLEGGVGVTSINDTLFFTVHAAPEIFLPIVNVGVGLDINILLDKNGKVRKTDWDNGYDLARIIRYIRYGHDSDPITARIGMLDHYSLGHGTIVNTYRNTVVYDDRRIGLTAKIEEERFGVEAFTSDLFDDGILGFRPSVRPLRIAGIDIPIVSDLTFGASYVTDMHPDADILKEYPDLRMCPTCGGEIITRAPSKISFIGVDIGLPLLRSSLVSVETYADHVSATGFGSGNFVGTKATFSLPLIELGAQAEYRDFGEHFIGAYFDGFYEIDRIEKDSNGFATTKAARMDTVPAAQGYYAGAYVRLANTIQVNASYSSEGDRAYGGLLHAGVALPNILGPGTMVGARYRKTNVQSVQDGFSLNERSTGELFLGYKPMPFVAVEFLSQRTFYRDAQGVITPQDRYSARIVLTAKF